MSATATKTMSLEIQTSDEEAFAALLNALAIVRSTAIGAGCMAWLIVDGQMPDEETNP